MTTDPGGISDTSSTNTAPLPSRSRTTWMLCTICLRTYTVERALRIYGPPVYVRKQIVHHVDVVHDLLAHVHRRPVDPEGPLDGVRAQADRAQHPRGAGPRGQGRGVRGGRVRDPAGVGGHPVGARRGPGGLRGLERASPPRDRRDLPPSDQGAPRGPAVRPRRADHPADRPRGPRGSHWDDGRGAGERCAGRLTRGGPERGGPGSGTGG